MPDVAVTIGGMNRLRRPQASPRYALCRRALRGTPLQVPAELLTTASVAEWVRRRGWGVDVSSAEELRLALAAGLPAEQVAAQCADDAAIEAAVAARVGRFIIGNWSEVMLLARCRPSTPRVLLDVTEGPGDRMAASLMAAGRVDVVGLRHRIGGDDDDAREAAHAMLEQMARLRRSHDVILTRLCLSGFGHGGGDAQALRQEVHRLQLTVEEACAELRYPRPVLGLSLHAAALVGAD